MDNQAVLLRKYSQRKRGNYDDVPFQEIAGYPATRVSNKIIYNHKIWLVMSCSRGVVY